MISRKCFRIDWKKKKLDFEICRVIGFDNAACMAGVHGGIQRLLQNINGKTEFVPCSNHCLNLCSVYVSSVNASGITFFGGIERHCIFFSSSNHQWEVLSSNVKVMMKRLVTTCSSARYEAVYAVRIGFQGMIQALNSLTSSSENLQTRGDAQIILLSIENFSFMSHLFYWEEIPGQINLIQKKLQNMVLVWMCVEPTWM